MSYSEKAAGELPLRLTKTTPPVLPKILPRPRLQALFDANRDKNLVLIIGQAAQGKSTMAACYFQNAERPSAWINLGQEESDPVNFYSLLIQATRSSLPPPSLSLIPQEDSARYREWVLTLINTLKGPFQIFLDGLDRLVPQAETFRFLQILIEELPPHICLFLLSREYPPLSLTFQQRKMGRLALLLKNEDLAFTPQEIKEYFRALHGLTLNAPQVARIFKATEGWIGGITLLSEALTQVPQDAVDAFLKDKLPDHFHRNIFQYFGQEIFTTFTPSQQIFLLQTSILNRLEPEVIQEFSPQENGQDFLRELTRKNLFVLAFPDPQKGVIFRYHQLFKDFLETLLRSKRSGEEVRELQIRAGAVYEKKGEMEEAITHYLNGRAYTEAATLIKQVGLSLVKQARLSDLTNWVQALPRPLIQADPWLLLFKTLANRFITLEENMQILKEALALFKVQGDRSGLLLSMGLLIEAEFIWGKHRPELVREAEELLTFPDNESFLYERAFLWRQIGWAHSIRGNPRRGYWASQKAYLLANQVADPLMKAGALAHAVSSLAILGEFRQAEHLLQELNSFSWRSLNAEILFIHSISKLLFLIFHGDLQIALELCTNLLKEAEKQGLFYLYPFFLLHQQVTLSYVQEPRQANEIHQQLLNLAASANNGFLKGATIFFAAISDYRSDRRAEARDLFDQATVLFAAGESSSEVYLNGARLARALLNDQPETCLAAVTDLRSLVDYWEKFESYLFLTEGHLALGLLYHDQGLKDLAQDHLQKGFTLARQRDFRHFMIISPRDTARACLLAQEYLGKKPDLADYASRLLLKNFAPLVERELEKWDPPAEPQVVQRIQGIQLSLHRVQTPVLRIQTFGVFRLFFDAEEMAEKAWDRHQPRQLLMAILCQKNERVHKEVLIEALWPEEKPGVGEKNFKTALQRLRKSLEPNMSPTFGSSYVHLQNNLVFLDQALCRVDTRKFWALYKEGQEKEKVGDPKAALDYFSQALDLYQGDFLPEEQYAPWTIRCREELKEIYIDLLARTARYHEQAGSFKKAVACLKHAIEADPLFEEAYRSLMSLYAGRNMVTEALRIYEACRKALKTGLDARPGPITEALYQGIKERAQKS